MGTRNRTVPRFLPTLTEVVQGPDPASGGYEAAPAANSLDADLAGVVLREVQAELAPRLQHAVHDWLREQLDTPESPLRLQIETLVQEAWIRETARRSGPGS